MTEELRKRVARALAKHNNGGTSCPWDSLPNTVRRRYMNQAIAAIAAMPTPSFDAMRAAYLAGARGSRWTDGALSPAVELAAADYATEHAGVEDTELAQLRATNAELLAEIERQRSSGDGDVALIHTLRCEKADMMAALRACRQAVLHNAPEPRRNICEIVDTAITRAKGATS